MRDWIQCHERAVEVGSEFFQELGLMRPDHGEQAIRALLSRLAQTGITVAWNTEEVA
jgi:hypothetical protein